MKREEVKHPATGEELYRSFLDGNRSAFDELVALYESELSAFINGIVHDYHESKHLTIETFAQLAASNGQFSKKSSLKTYLFTIGKNLAYRYTKKRGREQHMPLEKALETLIPAGDTPHDAIERDDIRQIVRDAMSTLKAEHRTVLLLLYFEDMSYRIAGKVMNKSVKQISDLAYRAKSALKKKIEGDERFRPSSGSY